LRESDLLRCQSLGKKYVTTDFGQSFEVESYCDPDQVMIQVDRHTMRYRAETPTVGSWRSFLPEIAGP
jgi:hypothetical protein